MQNRGETGAMMSSENKNRCGLKGWMWEVIKLSYFRGECCGIDVCLRLIAATNFKKIWVPWVKVFNPKWVKAFLSKLIASTFLL